jgi:hypothetical protein
MPAAVGLVDASVGEREVAYGLWAGLCEISKPMKPRYFLPDYDEASSVFYQVGTADLCTRHKTYGVSPSAAFSATTASPIFRQWPGNHHAHHAAFNGLAVVDAFQITVQLAYYPSLPLVQPD